MVRKKYTLVVPTKPQIRTGLPEIPVLQTCGMQWDFASKVLHLELCGEEAAVDEAAELLLAHFTPNVVVRAWQSIVSWWNS